MKLKKYSHYKDSHIDWIWEIPEDWSVRRLKFINKLQWWYAFKSEEFSEEWNDIIRIWDIKDNVDFNNAKKYPESIKIHKDFKIKNNDVLIALTWATIWKVWKVNNYSWKAYINQRVAKLSWTNNYYYYLLKSDFIKKQIELIWDWSAQENISNWQIEDFFIPFNDKQEVISSFLDSKTLQIENLIEKDKKLIELLKERRVSLINKAVTKGLDDSVKMKDSWVDWIWDIPQTWWNTRLKFLSKIFSWWTPDKTKLEEYWENWTIPWLASWEVNQEYIKYPTTYITKEWFNNSSAKMIKKWSILMALAWQWKTKGTVWYLEFKSTCNQSLWAIEIHKEYNSKFIFYWLKNNYKNIRGLVWDWERDWLNLDHLSNIPVPLPKIQEQQKIVDFLDKETVKIYNHIKKVERRIELYEEYKKSLIYNVVTGKVEV